MSRQLRPEQGTSRAVTAIVIALVGALALVALGGAAWIRRDGTTVGSSPLPTMSSGEGSRPTSPGSSTPSSSTDHTTEPMDVNKIPVSLKLPNVDDPTPVDLSWTGPDGELIVPESGQQIAFFIGSAYPGDATGTTVIAGHKDTQTSVGVFAKLADLETGDRLDLATAGSETIKYEVTGYRDYGKSELPQDLFSRKGPARLALITCSGPYDDEVGAYPNNLVVYASPA